ncbi:RNA polymerase sigma factor [Polyangium aurulentum]|uniref:RNA polymerase sigma factor n=1 Tax=Polyangium aurulentum TaxID=2567896 RepID=UPI0010AE5ED7|nr:RNA polymerase sigma factor [Polyangium aurulentum]UQA57069.1 RNA polymerase sigma factor [Polyangium aurulentum]
MTTEAIQDPPEGSLSIGEIYQRFGKDLPSWLLRFGVLAADVPDLRQDVLVRVWRERLVIPRETRAARLAMFKIARETVKPHRRRMVRRSRHVVDADPAELSAPGSVEEAEALCVDLMAAIDTLAEPYREVVMECDVAGYSIAEVAARTGQSENTVWAQLRRGRSKVRARLIGSKEDQRAALIMPFMPLFSDDYGRAVMSAIFSAEGRIPVPRPAHGTPFSGGPREPPPPPPPPPPVFPWLAGPAAAAGANAAAWVAIAAAAAVVVSLLLPRGAADWARAGLWLPTLAGIVGGSGAVSSPPACVPVEPPSPPQAPGASSPPTVPVRARPSSSPGAGASRTKEADLTGDARARVRDEWDVRVTRVSLQQE